MTETQRIFSEKLKMTENLGVSLRKMSEGILSNLLSRMCNGFVCDGTYR